VNHHFKDVKADVVCIQFTVSLISCNDAKLRLRGEAARTLSHVWNEIFRDNREVS
jgi:hypothetical protein